MEGERAGASPQDAIVIDYDDAVSSDRDREVIDLERRVQDYRPHRNRSLASQTSEGIDEEKDDDLASAALADFVDLTVDDEPVFIRESSRRRYQAPRVQERFHSEITKGRGGVHVQRIKIDRVYELDPEQVPNSAFGIEFILVNEIAENNQTGEFTVRGLPLCRSRTQMGKLPRKLNEVFLLYELDENDDRPAQIQGRVEVPCAAIIRPRSLNMTNAPYPFHRYDPRIFGNLDAIKTEGPLVCRWSFFVHYRNARQKILGKAHHWTLERVRADDVKKENLRVEEEILRSDWRGEVVLGGSYNPGSQALTPSSMNIQRYTVFDSFSGAGGFSRGAERAGLHIQYAADHWDKAANSYRLNFPETLLFQQSIDEFLLSYNDVPMRTDLLHLSPPCQTWSPAHTIPGQNDEANIAALFACRSLVEKLRPRIFTLEQTFGILQSSHDPFFCSLVGGFTEFGYSVTWKIVHLQTWGLPQTRKRLIMIGACPGEKLPPFPTATHSETGAGGLKKYVTIRQALSKIDHSSTFHNPDEELNNSPPPSGSVVSNPDEILRRCVTCSGGQNRHYSNTRAYTVREFASLQGFPVWHQFAPASKAVLKKQIGNAFPACVVRLLCEHLKNWLLEVDGLAPQRAARASVGGRELVFISEGPRSAEAVRPLIMPSLEIDIDGGGSSDNAITVIDEDDQVEIKFDFGPDLDMAMEDLPAYPDSPRSATMSLPSSPEPPQAGCVQDLPIMIID
ncbi:C-5 cytosine-specific DNA methylase [Colletotrichum karsti]|uniref:DNA (cytosine-5-)-methyltransferase n=1 Tax=Colletotrichum karsti TaxID=1095194 RepID=A0A9P6I9N1_9PEZI|nr:C-5 cytosine-specific DNA methylase [Colletotrichum karsti]KAF9879417.1 C-5 cytosine-specific DNA methylase [Colletotrichum karsti]